MSVTERSVLRRRAAARSRRRVSRYWCGGSPKARRNSRLKCAGERWAARGQRRDVERLAVAGVDEVLRAEEMANRMDGLHGSSIRDRRAWRSGKVPGVTTQTAKGEAFRALHAGEPFVIPNPWDAGSARVLAALGFRALATTSSGFAFTLGRLDGGVTLDEVAAHVGALAEATELPVSVDLENGYGPEPEAAALGRSPGSRRRGRWAARSRTGIRSRASTSSATRSSGSPRRSRPRERSTSPSR